MAASRSDRHIF